jgi:ATP-binding cassette subfamily B protein
MLRNLRRLFRQARPYRLKLGIGIAAALSYAGLNTVSPVLVRGIIDHALPGHDTRRLVLLISVLIGVGLVRALCFGTRRQLAGRVSIDVEADLREELYEHVQALDMGYHERISTGQLMSRGSSDLQAIRNYMTTVPWSFTLTLQIIGVTVAMTLLDWQLALISIFTMPFLAISTYRFAKRFDPVIWRMQQKLAELASVVEETVTGIRVVKGFGRERHQVAKLEREATAIYDAAVDSIKLRSRFVPVFNLLPQVGVAAVLWYGGRQVIAHDITLGTLVAFNAYLSLLVNPLRNMGHIVTSAQRAATAVGRVFEVLDTAPGVADQPAARKLAIHRGDVLWEGVRFAYPGGGPVLEGVDLEIPAGTSLALVGPTGCGKSTLARLVLRFIEPHEGRVLIDGTDIRDVTLRSLRSQIGMVFEDTFLFSDSIAANIAFGRPDAHFDDIVGAAAVAQAHSFIEELPDQYETVVGEQGYTLSGGQRQRIAIARAILMNPRLLILDDATSSVDARVEAQIRRGLQEAMSGRTTLIVARRPSSAALADRVALMDRGRIAAVGSHEDLWNRVPDYRRALAGTGSVDEVVSEIEAVS